jgi:hypothetical protein
MVKRWILIPLLFALPACAHASEVTRFLRDLGAKREATRADCLAGVAIALGMKRDVEPTSSLVAKLKKKGILQADDLGGHTDDVHLARSADRGFACLLFMRALGDEGGLMSRVFDSSERYAYRHLEFRGMIPGGGPWVDISGPELVALISTVRGRIQEGKE